MAIVLALVLAAPVIGLQSDGASPCDTIAFARDLRTLRPELAIVPLDAGLTAPAGAWVARLEGLPARRPVLRVFGNPTPLTRLLSAQDCRRVVEIAASIVDGLLDQLPKESPEPFSIAAPLHPSLGIWVGGGVLQAPIRWVPSIALGLRLSLGNWEIVGASDLGALATLPLATNDVGPLGRSCSGADCVYKALPFDFEVGGGYAPRLGPGNLSLDVLVGPSVVHAWAKGSPLFGTADHWSLEAFVALAVGYSLDLPARFWVGLRVEERWSPAQAQFQVDGATHDVATRVWALAPTLLAGWRFF